MLSREDAEALAHQLNCDHPLFFHQAVDLAVFRHAPAPSVIIPVDFQPLTVDADFTFAAAATEAPQAARA